MIPNWNEQTALITGGASGIGLAAAKRLAANGVKIALVDISAERIELALSQLPDGCIGIKADISSEIESAAAVDQAAAELGSLDILINCAGITGKTKIKCHEVELADFKRVMAVNIEGSFLMTRAALPHMMKRNYGRILLIASIAGKEGNPGMLSYSTSKAGVIGLVKSVGKEYADTGITVNALAPAVIQTPIVEALPQDVIDYMTSRIPMGRCGTLEEAASLIEHIVSPGNSFTTAHCYDLSGGRATY